MAKGSNKLKNNGTKSSLFKEEDYDTKSGGGSEDDDVDGIPLDGAALLKSANKKGARSRETRSDDSDLDGAPLDTRKSNKSNSYSAPVAKSLTSQRNMPAGFVPSKWETVDQKQLSLKQLLPNGIYLTRKNQIEKRTQLKQMRIHIF